MMGSIAVLLGRVVFAAILAGASVADIRTRRLPNLLTLGGLGAALLWHAVAPSGAGLFAREGAGAVGFMPSFLGASVTFGVFLLLHLLRLTGAGDVKLMAALGAVFTLSECGRLMVFVILAGGVISVGRMLNPRRRTLVIANLRTLLYSGMAASVGSVGPRFDPAVDTADRLPFGAAISLGAAAHAMAIWLGFFE